MLYVVESSSNDSVVTTSSCWGSWFSGDKQRLVASFHWDVKWRWWSPLCAHSTSCWLRSGK